MANFFLWYMSWSIHKGESCKRPIPVMDGQALFKGKTLKNVIFWRSWSSLRAFKMLGDISLWHLAWGMRKEESCKRPISKRDRQALLQDFLKKKRWSSAYNCILLCRDCAIQVHQLPHHLPPPLRYQPITVQQPPCRTRHEIVIFLWPLMFKIVIAILIKWHIPTAAPTTKDWISLLIILGNINSDWKKTTAIRRIAVSASWGTIEGPYLRAPIKRHGSLQYPLHHYIFLRGSREPS